MFLCIGSEPRSGNNMLCYFLPQCAAGDRAVNNRKACSVLAVACAVVRARAGDRAVDLCCGSGDIALLLAEKVGPSGQVRASGTTFQSLCTCVPPAEGRSVQHLTSGQLRASERALQCLCTSLSVSVGSVAPSECPPLFCSLVPSGGGAGLCAGPAGSGAHKREGRVETRRSTCRVSADSGEPKPHAGT